MSRNKIKLSQIVNDYLLSRDDEDYGSHVSRQKVSLLAKNGIREMLRKFGGGQIVSIKVALNSGTNSIPFPSDFMDYSKIGFVDGRGQIVLLGRNDRLAITQDSMLDDLSNILLDSDGYELTSYSDRTSAQSISSWADGGSWVNAMWGGSTAFNAYGREGIANQYGTYVVEYTNERIHFSSDFKQNHVVLEYLSDPTMAADFSVDQRMEEAVKSYIFWKSIERKGNVPENAKQLARKEYYNNYRLANNRIKKFTIVEASKVLKKSTKPVKT